MKRTPAVLLGVVLVACGGGSSDRKGGEGPAATGAGVEGGGSARPAEQETLSFQLVEGNIANHFFRRGAVAAHLLARSGERPRIVVAFPAGNSGIGLWFESPPAPATLEVRGALSDVERADGMRGVRARIRSSQPRLRASGLIMSSVRVLRDYSSDPKLLPPEIKNQVDAGPPLVVRRTTLDGQHHFALVVEPQDGATAVMDGEGGLVLTAATGKSDLEVLFTFLHDDPPLTPIPVAELLQAGAAVSERDRNALSFLAYREKMLAGSWRFLTYFGRDTLLSLCMLMPVLRPAAIEGGLGAVIERLDSKGEVAHEEDIGEFAALQNLRGGRGPKLDAIHDYKMVDDDFMLAPALARYLLETEAGKARAVEFMQRRSPGGETYAAAVARNLAYVQERAAPFAKDPRARKLVPVKPGLIKGDWRDSDEGLGFGIYSFSVNASLVPAALAASARLHESGLLCPEGDAACAKVGKSHAAVARSQADVWSKRAPPLFEVKIATARARSMITAYAMSQKLDPTGAVAAIDGPVVFPALSLDKGGNPVPVMHSDDSFVVMFNDPPPAELERIAERIVRPFPLGLRLPVGVVISNPAFVADRKKREQFARDRYHGAVVWSWQQAMLASGLARQLGRTDLPEATRAALRAAEEELWKVIRGSFELRTSEHWSWEVHEGKVRVFHVRDKEYESNAAQLWSTVFLAVKPPARQEERR